MSNSTSAAPASLVSQMEAQQALLGLSDQDLCTAIGFERTIVLTLIKAGTMRMPLKMIPALAAALELDAVDLFKTALLETDPDLLQIITDVFKPLYLSATETKLIRHLRELIGNQQDTPIELDDKVISTLVAA